MNIIAIDIGNTNVTIGLFLDDVEKKIEKFPGTDSEKLAQILEDFNRTTPRIAAKVGIKQGIQRKSSSLKKFHSWLLLENPNRTCALCSKPIMSDKEVSVDHVIPWSFLYSDDIWNLSFVHKGCNSQKSNTPPKQKAIKEQEQRNLRLHTVIVEQHKEKMRNKVFKELDFSLGEDLLRKMWTIYRR